MLVTQERQDGRIGFTLRNVPATYLGAVANLGFAELGRDDAHVRWLVPDAEGVDEALARFRGVAERMVRQAAGLEEVPWEEALLQLLDLVADSGIAWWLGGSAALAVRGVDVSPRDLDLITDRDGARELGQVLRGHLVEPCGPIDGWIGAWWGRAFLGARVEWVGEVRPQVDEPEPTDFGPTAAGRLEPVMWRGYRILVPPVELSRAVAVRRWLRERVAAIDRWGQAS